MTQTVRLEPFTLRAAVRPETIDAENRTAEIIFSTGARILRRGWDGPFLEELSLDKKHVRLGRLNNGAPLLNTHGGWLGPVIEDVFGVVESGRLEEGKLVGKVRFAKAEDDPKADQAFRKVRDGIVRNVSVGYRVYLLEKVESGEGKIPLFRATDWEPFEVSLVPIGADDGAKVRSDHPIETNPCQVVMRSAGGKESKMIHEERNPETFVVPDPLDPGAPTAPAVAPAPAQQTERTAGAADERDRCQGIIRAGVALQILQETVHKFIADGTSLVDAQTAMIEEAKARGGDTRGPRPGAQAAAITGEDPYVHVWRGIENALLHRVAPSLFKLEDVGKPYRGLSLLRLGEVCLQAKGIRITGWSKMEIAGGALGLTVRGMHTTSDFPKILEDVANKTLRRAYEEAPQTFGPLSRRVTLPDFKEVKRLQLGEAPELLKVLEHGEFKRGTIGEGREKYQLATFGRIFAITRKALVNDDTDSFSRITVLFGRAARDLESNLVWEQITSNPVMGDGIALFETATHGNLSATSDAIAVAAIGAGRASMRKQKGVDGKQKLNIVPLFLIVPVGKETIADQFVSVNLLASQSTNVNPFAGRLKVIAEPRLDDNSPTAWYLAGSPEQIDIIEYGSLEGEEGPVVESRIGFDIDGLEVKARHDFAAKVIDHRGLFKNPGA